LAYRALPRYKYYKYKDAVRQKISEPPATGFPGCGPFVFAQDHGLSVKVQIATWPFKAKAA
jgi:hypothetical protein